MMMGMMMMKQSMKWMILIMLIVSMLAGGSSVGAVFAEERVNSTVTEKTAASSAAPVTAAELPFSDISKHWAKDNILKAYEAGLVEGFEDGSFRPDDVVKADQFVVMMLRAHSVTTNGKTEFDPAWFAELEERQPGFLNMIQNAVLLKKFNFTNAKSGYWAAPYVDFIYEMGFIPTFDTIFPKDHKVFQKQLKREGMANLLTKWYSVYENRFDYQYIEFARSKIGLKDLNDFSYGGDSTITTMLLSGIMNGYPNQHFYPQRYVTRAEALTTVLRLRDKSLRQPFKPDLKGQHYIENEDGIHLFENKTEYDYYIKLREAAKKHVTKGYINLEGTGISVFSNKDLYEEYDYFTRTSQFDLRPADEMFVVVDKGYNAVDFSYPVTSKFTTSNEFVNAIYEIMAGAGKGKELRKKVEAYTKESMGKEFTFNGKSFEYYVSGNRFAVRLTY